MPVPVICPQMARVELPTPGVAICHAPAKLNLDLYVGPRRADGYHELDSAVVLVSLYDRLEVALADAPGISLTCSGANCGEPRRNLAVRAAEAYFAATGRPRGLSINITKRIPPGGGMGGGSSDAAAVLMALSALLGPAPVRLEDLAASLGSDVPLFLGPAASRMTGRGERVEPLQVGELTAMVYLCPHGCPTAEVYRKLDELRGACPPGPGRLADVGRPGMAGSCETWRWGLVNDLAAAAFEVCPAMAADWRELSRALAPVPVHVTGSGSCMFALCGAGEAAKLWQRVPKGLADRCVWCTKI
jgi:4-diphosphocytidyl-2-C-methyl-D-erythritol kinase